jgi:hypothetical protein
VWLRVVRVMACVFACVLVFAPVCVRARVCVCVCVCMRACVGFDHLTQCVHNMDGLRNALTAVVHRRLAQMAVCLVNDGVVRCCLV